VRLLRNFPGGMFEPSMRLFDSGKVQQFCKGVHQSISLPGGVAPGLLQANTGS